MLVGLGGTLPAPAATAAAPAPVSSEPPARAGSENATEDGQRALDVRVPPVDPTPYRGLIEARELLRHGQPLQARTRLAELVARYPERAGAIVAAARLDVQHAPGRLVADLDDLVRAVRLSFPLQSLLLARAFWWSIGTLLLGITLLAFGRAITVLAPLHHLFFERLSPATDERFARVAAATLLLLPLAWGLGPLGASLVLLVLGAQRPRPGDRLLVGAGILVLLVLGAGPRLAPSYLEPPDYRHAALVLATAQEGGLTPALDGRLGEIEEPPGLATLVRGLALARSGRPAAAQPVLRRYVRAHPGDPTGQLALGNTWLAARRPRAAAAAYQRALALAPPRAPALYNQALALAELLRFEESSRLMARASALDHTAVRTARTLTAARPAPIAARLPAATFRRLDRASRSGRGVPVPAVVRTLLPWRGGTLWPLALVMVGLAAAVRRRLWRRLTILECSICGRKVCRRCVRRARSRIFCQRCASEVGDVPSDQLVRVLAEGRRRRLQRSASRRGLLLDGLLPGYALARRGRPLLAATLLLPVAAGCMGCLLPGAVPPLPAAPRLFELPLDFVLPLAAALFGHLAAVLLGFALHARDLERGVHGHLIPLAGSRRESERRTGTDG